ncbi:hypothetical protein GBA52_016193 [Prunus armeniaca]|nr:hypothetical protein GBA52_016193 [Prunus armeniaca]
MPSSSSSARSPFSSPNEHLDTANRIVALLANIIGAAESVLRVAAIGPDKRLFFKTAHQITSYLNLLQVVFCLYKLSALRRLVSGLTVAYAAENSPCMFVSISEENE